MYADPFPDVDDLVVVEVAAVSDIGVYVKLLEYGGLEGLIILSELSRKRIRSVSRLASVGQRQVASVMRVDRDKGYVDLSRRRVTPEEQEAVLGRYARARTLHSMVFAVSQTLDRPMLELYERHVWPHDADFEAIADENVRLAFLSQREHHQKAGRTDDRARITVELTCFGRAGIDGIKSAIRAAQAAVPGVRIVVQASPRFMAEGPDSGTLAQALTVLRSVIEAYDGGRFAAIKTAAATDPNTTPRAEEFVSFIE